IWVADEHKKRTFFNRTWLDFTGRTFEEEAGDGWTKDIHKDDIKGYLEVYTRSFEKRQPFRHQYRLRRHDGEYRWILATGKPLFSAEGAFSGFLGACNEIHDQRLASEELEKKIAVRTRELTQALDREKDLNEMKSRFVSIASHEFRTPLTAILSSIALLEKYTPEQYAAAGPKHLTRIKTSINILKEILNDFLSVEKLEENKVQVAKEDFDVCEEIKDIEETTRGILKPGQQVVYTHTGEKKVSADKKILRNILINLLSNASKFSGAEKDIRLESRHADGKLVISVADQGIGISKKDQAQLFQRFYRATNAGNVQGTGLGLNIVRRYLDLVGGSITLKSKIGQGTTFTIEIPIPG
ncbi:MAG: PAS domain-containing sensor histidine kinase, partial [Bacteroidetes bacterium]|nr:PAS domain-containing sensor histidine kinase [Bacteroidota bacterium]